MKQNIQYKVSIYKNFLSIQYESSNKLWQIDLLFLQKLDFSKVIFGISFYKSGKFNLEIGFPNTSNTQEDFKNSTPSNENSEFSSI